MTISIDFHEEGILGQLTGEADEPYQVLEEEVNSEGLVMFVIDARGERERFYEAFSDTSGIATVERIGETKLLVEKDAYGAAQIIKNNHGKLHGVDKVHGSSRVFNVLFFRKQDIRDTFDDLREIGDVRINQLVSLYERDNTLSERQREVLELALARGYFDWPREIDIETLADELDLAHSTALEHLRKAEKKLLKQSLQTTAQVDRI